MLPIIYGPKEKLMLSVTLAIKSQKIIFIILFNENSPYPDEPMNICIVKRKWKEPSSNPTGI